jgi:DNA-binding GntR family transcriptional regulator
MTTEYPDFEKLERDPMHERVYRALRNAIFTASFKPGQKLTVRGISEAFEVSTMPVRAAFTRLVAERVLTAQGNGTITIPILTRATFDELVGLRVLLEGIAAERAAALITQAELAALDRLAEALTAATTENDANAYLEGNFQFKFAVFRAARSPALEDLIERIWLQISPFMRFFTEDVRGQADSDRHMETVAALRRSDGDGARAAMREDILGGAEFLRQHAKFAEPDPATS